MKIKIITMVACPPWNLSALPGDEIEIEEKQALELISMNRAISLDEVKPQTEEAKPAKPAKKAK